MRQIRINSSSYTVRTETINNQEYLVVPVVMMREGVHSGSHGAIYHRAEELGRYVEAWNGIPAVISHPQENGVFVSANSPAIREQYAVGTIYNAHMDGDRLKADVYLLQADLERISPETLEMINSGSPLDVSVGVFSDAIQEEGNWNGETYHSIASNYRPDHLALLPHEEGACNWNDGCGIRNNSKTTKTKDNEETMDLKAFKAKAKEYLPLQVNQDYTDRVNNIQRMLDDMDSEGRYHWLDALFEDHFYYRVSGSNVEGGREYFRQPYIIDADDAVVFEGAPVKVRKNVEFVEMQNNSKMRRTKPAKSINNNSKEDNQMDLTAKVNQLIANSNSGFCESDREFLMTQAEEKIDAWQALAEQKTTAPQANAEQPKEEPKQPLTMEAYLNSIPAELRDQVAHGLQLHANQRQQLITKIQANAKDVWTTEELQAMSTQQLEKIDRSQSVAKPAESPTVIDYSVFGSGPKPSIDNNAEVPVMMPTGMAPKEDK